MNKNNLLNERHELLEKGENLVASSRAQKRDLTADEALIFDGIVARMRAIDADLDKCETNGRKFERETDFPRDPRANNNRAQNYPVILPHGMQASDAENGRRVPVFAKGDSIEAFVRQSGARAEGFSFGDLARAMIVGGGAPEVRAALAEGTDSAGGITVPVVLSGSLIDQLRARSSVFQAGASTMVLDTGKATTIVRIAGDPTATWRAENAAVATSDATFDSVSLTPKTLAVVVVASRELVDDSSLLDQALRQSITSAFAAELDRVALMGSGSGSEPKGASKITGVGSVSMGTSGAALTNYDPFVQALGTLRTNNSLDPTACILHPRSDQELNLLKDSTNQPLRRPQAIENLPFLVTSKLPINETQGGANTASRAVMGYFPDLIVGMRMALQIQVLRERYADNYQVGFLASLRADIAVRHAASFCNVVGIL